MSFVSEAHDGATTIQIAAEAKIAEPPTTFEDLTQTLGQELFTQNASKLREHSKFIAENTALCKCYTDIVLASRTIYQDADYDRVITTAASNAISVLNYGSRSGIFTFSFSDVHDWSCIRVPGANLNYVVMAQCNLDDADLSGSSLINPILRNCQLKRTNFTGVMSQELAVFTIRDRSNQSRVGPKTLVVSPNGRIGASAAGLAVNATSIRIFNLETEEAITYLNGHDSSVIFLKFNCDGKLLLSASEDRVLCVWDVTTGQRKSTLHSYCEMNANEELPASHIQFSPDGHNLVIVSNHNTVGIWNLETSQLTTTFQHEHVHGVDWCPSDYHRILSYSSTGKMCIWDLTTNTCVFTWQMDDINMCFARFSVDGSKIVISGNDFISVIDAVTGNLIATRPKRDKRLNFVLDHRYVYWYSPSNFIYVLDLETLNCITKLETQLHKATELCLTADGRYLVAYAFLRRTVTFWNIASFESCTPDWPKDEPSHASLTFSPDHRYLLAGCNRHTGTDKVQAFDLVTGHCTAVLSAPVTNDRIVTHLVYSPNGQYIALVVDSSYVIEIYDAKEKECIITLTKHTNLVTNLKFSPKGDMLASTEGGNNESLTRYAITLWDTAAWNYRELQGHTQEVTHICFSPDGDVLASISEDLTLRLWSISTVECVQVINGYFHKCLSYSPCGRFVASCVGRSVNVWDVASGNCMNTFDVPSDTGSVLKMFIDLCFLPNGRIVGKVAGCHFYDLFTQQRAQLSRACSLMSTRLWMNSDYRLLATHPTRAVTYIWEFPEESWKSETRYQDLNLFELQTLHHIMPRTSLVDGEFSIISSSGQEGLICVRGGLKNEAHAMLQGHSDAITCLASSFDTRCLVSGSLDKTVRVWNLDTQECIAILEGHADTPSCVQFSFDNQRIASGSEDSTIRVWNISDCKCLGEFKGHTTPIKQIIFSSNDTRLASIGKASCAIYLWDLATTLCSAVLDHHTDEVFEIQFSSDGCYLASGSHDDTIRVWEMQTNDCIAILKGHTDCLTCFIWSNDNKTLVSGSEDKTLRVWDALTGECMATLQGHTGHIRSLCLTPDKRCIISAANDHVIHIWDLANGVLLHQLIGHTASVISVRLIRYDDQGESVLISTSLDRSLRVWTICNMSSRIELLPKLRTVFGLQHRADFEGTDLTDATMDSHLSKLIKRYSGRIE